MPDSPEAGDMTVDRHIVGWIGKHHVCFFITQHPTVTLGRKGICAKDAMRATKPEVARPRHRYGPGAEFRQLVFLIEATAVEMDIDFAHLEAGDLEFDQRFELENFGELE